MAGPRHLIVVDDDPVFNAMLERYLTRNGFKVTALGSGDKLIHTLSTRDVALVVLDLMLPGKDGLELIREIRQHNDLPVIMLTGMGDEHDRIVGLEMGADDYLPKPFNPRELLARIRAVLKRARPVPSPDEPSAEYRFGSWVLDTGRRNLMKVGGRQIKLTPGEYDLLLAFVTHPNRVLSRDQLLDLTRGREFVPFDRSVDNQVSRLRRKIEDDPRGPRFVKTVRGGGYMFSDKVGTS